MKRTTEDAFETVIEAHLLQIHKLCLDCIESGYIPSENLSLGIFMAVALITLHECSETRFLLRSGMFVAWPVDECIESIIPDGAHCLLAVPVRGTRHGTGWKSNQIGNFS